MKNKARRNIIIVFFTILVLVLGFFGTLYYITSTVNNYSYTEKKWITENSDKTIDVYLEQSLPVFSYNGSGVYYDYLNALKEDTGLSINVDTSGTATTKFINTNTITDKDIVVFRDHFIVIGAKDSVEKLGDLNYKKIGVLKNDKNTVAYYLTEYQNVNIKEYEKYDDLKNAYGFTNV